MGRRRKKEEIHIIDMNSRLHIKIVKSTIEEDNELQMDLDEVQKIVERKMFQYEQNLKRLINNALSDYVIDTTEKDADYFIQKYKEQFENRNPDNIRNRIEQYQRYIKEQDS